MPILPIHVTAGLLALAAGAIALSVAKGGTWHRKAGTIFVYAMLVMSSLGAIMAATNEELGSSISVIAGALAFYLVSTAYLTVRFPVDKIRVWIIALMLVAWVIGIGGIRYAVAALNSPNGRFDGLPAGMYMMFATVAVVAALLDMRMLLARGIVGAQRLIRHLWRMGFAMFIATASFFLGQAKFFPEPIRKSGLLAIPVLLVIGTTLYWLVRTARKRRQLKVTPDKTDALASSS